MLDALSGREEAGGPVPLTILTGFLGSGKTSVLNHALRSPAFADTAVIVNEFGEVGIDHLLIEEAVEDAVLLKNGCLCCTIRGDIADTLAELAGRRAAGFLPPFRRVVIETTGLADPAPIAEIVAGLDPAQWRLGAVVATADATLVLEQLGSQPEVARQIALADIILLTKCDLAAPARIAAAEAALRGVNPAAPIRHVAAGAADPEDLMPPPLRLVPDAKGTRVRNAHANLRFRHHEAIRSVVLRASKPLDPDGLAAWLGSLLSLRSEDVLRLKGIVIAAGADRPLLVQAVEHALQPPVWLDIPLERAGQTRIVVIGRRLPETGLRESFAAWQRETRQSQPQPRSKSKAG